MKIYVSAPAERPDFRLVIAFLWHDGQNVDTDGDSHNPASRNWTELYLCNRENSAEMVDISPAQQTPLILEVESELEVLAARTAYFLACQTRGQVFTALGESGQSPNCLLELMGEFQVEGAMRRVEKSPFTRATIKNPYPNLRANSSK